MNYLFYDLESGEIKMSGIASESMISGMSAPAGQGVLFTATDIDPDAARVDLVTEEVVPYSTDGQIRKRGLRAQTGHRWDPLAEVWIDERPIEEVRAGVLRALKQERDARINGGFTWDGSTFDSDTDISQPRILGLFTTHLAGAFPVAGQPWRLADNSWRIVFSEDMPGIWGALQAHLSTCFATFGAHEAAILSLTDFELLQNYNFQTGWPA